MLSFVLFVGCQGVALAIDRSRCKWARTEQMPQCDDAPLDRFKSSTIHESFLSVFGWALSTVGCCGWCLLCHGALFFGFACLGWF